MRAYSGWIALVMVILALAGVQLYDYLTRPSGFSTVTREREVRSAIIQKRIGAFGRSPRADAKDPLAEQAKELDAEPPSRAMAELRTGLSILRRMPARDFDLLLLRKGTKDQQWLASAARQCRTDRPSAKAQERYPYQIAVAMTQARGNQTAAVKALVSETQIAIFFLTILGFLGLGFLALVVWALFLVNKPAVVPHPIGSLNGETQNRVAGSVAAALCLMFVLGPLVMALLPKEMRSPGVLLLLQTMVFCLAAYPVLAEHKGLLQFPNSIGRDLAWGAGGYLLNIPMLAVALGISQVLTRWLPAPEHPATVKLIDNPSLIVILGTFFSAVVLAPIFEEIFFRGALLPAAIGALKSRFWGFVLVNLAFAVIHPTGVPAWPALAATGIASSLVIYRSGSLRASMLMHALHNGTILLITLLMA